MNTHTLIKISLVGLILLMIVSACGVIGNQGAAVNVEEKAQTIVAMTLESEHQIQTIVAATINAANEESVLTPETTDPDTLRISNPTKTPDTAMLSTATITATPTPETAMVNVSMDTNCRKGPGRFMIILAHCLLVSQLRSWEYPRMGSTGSSRTRIDPESAGFGDVMQPLPVQ